MAGNGPASSESRPNVELLDSNSKNVDEATNLNNKEPCEPRENCLETGNEIPNPDSPEAPNAPESMEMQVFHEVASEERIPTAAELTEEPAAAESNEIPNETPDDSASYIPRSLAWRLYLSHFLSTWNSRSFEFGSVLFLANIYPNTLLYLSIYAMCRSAAAIALSARIGKAIDQKPRLQVVRSSIVGGRLAVILSALGFWSLCTYRSISYGGSMGIFSGLVILSCVEKAASIANLVSVERDWVVVIANGDERILQKLNARMRRIDLFCKLAGPLFIALIDGASTTIAVWFTLGSNVISLPIEYFAIARVNHMVPNLQLPKPTPPNPNQHEKWWRQPTQQAKDIRAAFQHYFQHPACRPSFALALLYFTVLSFGGQMVTYLIAAGFNSFYIGLVRSLSVVIELSATWIAPRVMSRISPTRAGMWFLNWQILWLAATISFFWSEKKAIIAASGLSAGTILSRVGLWGYDLSAQVIIQTEVQVEARGSFSSTEAAFQNLFELMSYALTIALPRPNEFKYPTLISGIAVLTAGVIYASFLRRRRGHLVHVSCLKGHNEHS